jgi:hypothetical protein
MIYPSFINEIKNAISITQTTPMLKAQIHVPHAFFTEKHPFSKKKLAPCRS